MRRCFVLVLAPLLLTGCTWITRSPVNPDALQAVQRDGVAPDDRGQVVIADTGEVTFDDLA